MNKKLLSLAMAFSFALSLTACAKEEEVPLVAVDSEEDVVSFSLVPVVKDDVVQTKDFYATYIQTSSQEVSFDMTGKYVNKVYVKEGSTVKKGDLLCELSSDSLVKDIDALKYRIKKNELQLSYIDEQESLSIQDAWVQVLPYNGNPGEDYIESIKKQYDKQRTTYNDSLEFDRLELERKQKELRSSKLYASMDGTVYKLKNYLEGSTSKAGEVIMTIVDDSSCLFEAKDLQYKDYIKPDDTINMSVIHSGASGDYTIKPEKMDEWTDSMYFSVFTSPENAVLEVGVNGTIKITTEAKYGVLSVPKSSVRFSGDKAFVYTLNEDNIREIRYVEVGLCGDERVEIISGLSEGEKVLLK